MFQLPSPPSGKLGGRYTLLAPLGEGGTGTVYRAEDSITGSIVAVKILSPFSVAGAVQHRREVLALRVLQTPGVVKLLDEGVSEDRYFLVTELIDGLPFPGARGSTWADVAPTVIALLETLARVHAAGLIHRDLKPGNVLVGADGRPVILDFGLARGEPLGLPITRPDTVVGTPRYQAPEQLTNNTLDPRTDLYAVGIMLYEVLAGQPPHTLDNTFALYAARLWRDAPPLAWAAPDAPREVAEVVDRLLARLPDARPRSATEVLLALRGIVPFGERAPFPWLGSEAPLDALTDATSAGLSFDLAGVPGSGRTRCLQEVSARLVRSGRRSVWTTGGSRPYESLRGIVGDVGGDAGPESPAEVARQVELRARETLAGGTVILVDDAEEVDPWSAEVLEAVRQTGPVVRAWRSHPAPSWRLAPISALALRALFHGPDRLLHLREDGARALFERTGGLPARVVSEVSAWMANGLASWRDGRVTLDRTALNSLDGGVFVSAVLPAPGLDRGPLTRGLDDLLAWITLAWPHGTPALLHEVVGGAPAWEIDLLFTELERLGAVCRTHDGRIEPRQSAVALQEWPVARRRSAHAALARALPIATIGRFAHLVGAGELADAAVEARAIAGRLVADGYVGRAIGVLFQGLYVAREAGDRALEGALLADATKAALLEYTAGAMRQVQYEIGRAGWDDGTLAPLDALLDAAIARDVGDTDRIAARLANLPRFADRELDAWHRSLELYVPMLRSMTEAEALLDRWLAEAARDGDDYLRGKVLGWQGLLRYRQGRFGEAADLHARSLPLKEGTPDQLSTMINAASACMEACRLDEGAHWASEAFALASHRRLLVSEARATWMLRAIAYRMDDAPTPDLDLVEAAGMLGIPWQAALIAMTEATVAWRSGHLAQGARLASQAAAFFVTERATASELVSEALARSCAQDQDVDAWRQLGHRAVALDHPSATPQVLGVIACAGVTWEPGWTEAAERCVTTHPSPQPAQKQSVMAQDEVLRYCRRATAALVS